MAENVGREVGDVVGGLAGTFVGIFAGSKAGETVAEFGGDLGGGIGSATSGGDFSTGWSDDQEAERSGPLGLMPPAPGGWVKVAAYHNPDGRVAVRLPSGEKVVFRRKKPLTSETECVEWST